MIDKNILDPIIYSQTFGDRTNVRFALTVLEQMCYLVVDKKQLVTDIRRMLLIHCMVDTYILQRPIDFKQECMIMSGVNTLVSLYTHNIRSNDNPILNYIMLRLEEVDKQYDYDNNLKQHELMISRHYSINDFMDKIIDTEIPDINGQYYIPLSQIMTELWDNPNIIGISYPQFLLYYTDVVYSSILSFYSRYEEKIKNKSFELPELFNDIFIDNVIESYPVLGIHVWYTAILSCDIYTIRNLLLSEYWIKIKKIDLTALFLKSLVDTVLIDNINITKMLSIMIQRYPYILKKVYTTDDEYMSLGQTIIDLSLHLIYKTLPCDNHHILLEQCLELIRKICSYNDDIRYIKQMFNCDLQVFSEPKFDQQSFNIARKKCY